MFPLFPSDYPVVAKIGKRPRCIIKAKFHTTTRTDFKRRASSLIVGRLTQFREPAYWACEALAAHYFDVCSTNSSSDHILSETPAAIAGVIHVVRAKHQVYAAPHIGPVTGPVEAVRAAIVAAAKAK